MDKYLNNLTMDNKKLTPYTIESNKLVAEFMEIPKCDRCIEDCGRYKFGSGIFYAPEKMEYHCNWTWQIEVWSKLVAKVRELLLSKDGAYVEKDIMEFYRIKTRYEKAVDVNAPEDGFEAVIKLLDYYKSKALCRN